MHCKVLDENQISRVHQTSLAILEQVGVVIPHDDMLNRLEGAGARVDRNEQRARIPEQLVMQSIEQAIFGVAMTQLGKHYGLPVYINVGLTDSKRPDAQAGLEAGMTLALGAAAGADIFGHMGISGVDQASSLDMLLLQDEIIGYVESTMRTIDFSDEALGFSAVEEVGPGGSFIDLRHTAQHFRREMWLPTLLDREYYQAWLDAGATSTEERCRQRKEEVLAGHQPEPISADLERALDEIVEAARRELHSP